MNEHPIYRVARVHGVTRDRDLLLLDRDDLDCADWICWRRGWQKHRVTATARPTVPPRDRIWVPDESRAAEGFAQYCS